VTNGQEELASLACLITIAFVEANGDTIESMGNKIEKQIKSLVPKFPSLIEKTEGKGHLLAINFKQVDQAVDYVKHLNKAGIDVSTQTYKANCPPSALLKFPFILTERALDFFVRKSEQILSEIAGREK
jgi:acetylornithine/succinyldiaminopimelate/putrescine aminotransferase